MAEIDFILTENEQALLLGYLEYIEAVFVPDIDYWEPQYTCFVNAHEAVTMWREANAREGSGPILLLWRGISTYEHKFSSFNKNGKTKYFLLAKEGGPYISFGPCKCFAEERTVTSGSVGYYSKYWIEELDDHVTVSEEIKAKYTEISKFIKKMTTRIKTRSGKRSYWVGSEALEKLRSGEIVNTYKLNI